MEGTSLRPRKRHYNSEARQEGKRGDHRQTILTAAEGVVCYEEMRSSYGVSWKQASKVTLQARLGSISLENGYTGLTDRFTR